MIVTLTLNPSLDRTIEVAALTRGSVLRAQAGRLDPGGKGVNVTRALVAARRPSVAVLPVGGRDGDQLQGLLEAEGMTVRVVPVAGRTRSNVTIVEPGGVVTKLNEPGSPLTFAELDAVIEAVLAESVEATWVVACGSLPPGVPETFYGELCGFFAPTGIRVAVDTSGPALPAALAAGPDLVKPNREELADVVGRPLDRLSEVIAAAGELRALGAKAVLVSLGAEGAVLVDDDGIVTGKAPVAVPNCTVGAGDALLAGFLAAGARGPAALAEGLAWAAAAVRQPASGMPGLDDIGHGDVHVQRATGDRPLLT